MRNAWLVVMALTGCRGEPTDDGLQQGQVPKGAAAVVSSSSIALDAVRDIAAVQRLDPEQARNRAVADAVLAQEAREVYRGTGLVAQIESATLARALLEEIDAASKRAAISDKELSEATARRWYEFDRPASARTVHAVVLTKNKADSVQAKRLAQRIRAAVKDATTVDEFEQQAKTVTEPGLQVRVERLEACTPDGRLVALDLEKQKQLLGASSVVEYARAANELKAVGDISPVVETEFGYHVIMLLERLPAKRVDEAQRRRALADDIHTRRAAAEVERILQAGRRQRPVQIVRAVDALTRQVRVNGR